MDAQIADVINRRFWDMVSDKGEEVILNDRINSNHIIIFAFRYGITRKTGAPLMIANYIKKI